MSEGTLVKRDGSVLRYTFVRRPLQGKIGLLDRLRSGPRGRTAETVNNDLRQLSAAVDGLMSALAAYGPELMQVRDEGGAYFSEPLEFLSYLLNGEDRPVRLCQEDIAKYLPARRISPWRAPAIGERNDMLRRALLARDLAGVVGQAR